MKITKRRLDQIIQEEYKRMLAKQRLNQIIQEDYSQQGNAAQTRAGQGYQSRGYQSQRTGPAGKTTATETFMYRGDPEVAHKGVNIQSDFVDKSAQGTAGGADFSTEDIALRSKEDTPGAAQQIGDINWRGQTATTTTSPTGKTKETSSQFIQPASQAPTRGELGRGISESRLNQMIQEELNKMLAEAHARLDSSKRHVFKKLKSGHWGKVYRPEGESQEGDLVIKPNTRGFPYGSSKDDEEERQDFLNSMAKD